MTSPLSALSETSTEYSGSYAIAHLEKGQGQSFGSVGMGTSERREGKEKIELEFPAVTPTRSWSDSEPADVDVDADLEKGRDRCGLVSVREEEIAEDVEDDRSEVKASAI